MKYTVTHQAYGRTFTPESTRARVLMVPFATDPALIEDVLKLEENQHHAWGVKELLKANVEVTVTNRGKPFAERFGQDWKLPNTKDYDLIYSNHNRLIRTPLERLLGISKTPLVSLVYAGEALFLPEKHYGVMCMTPYAQRRFENKNTKALYAPWGVDPESKLHEPVSTTGDHFISTGVTERDFTTLFSAVKAVGKKCIVAARGQTLEEAPANVEFVKEFVGPWDIRELYKGACAGLVILRRDDAKRMAVGWTNILELMAVGIPIIKTRAGSLDEIVDIEAIGAGFLVDPEDPKALANAMQRLHDDPELQQSMGRKGADYVRQHLNMDQFAKPLIDAIDDITT